MGRERLVYGEGVLRMEVMEDDLEPDLAVTSDLKQVPYTLHNSLVLLTFTLSALVLLLPTRWCRCLGRPLLAFWGTDHGWPLRVFFQKVCVFNCVVTLLVHMVYVGALEESTDACEEPLDSGWLLTLVSAVTLISAALRFLAMLLPHNRMVRGYAVYSPPELAQLASYSQLSVTFRAVMRPFSVISVLTLVGLVWLLTCAVPPHSLQVCAAMLPPSTEGRLQMALLYTLLAVLPPVCAIAVEHAHYCLHFRKSLRGDVPGFYLILSSPFVISMFVTTWSGWLVTMVISLVAMDTRPEIQTTYWCLFAALDSLWMLVLFLLTTSRNRTT